MRSKTQLFCNDSLASTKTTECRFCHVVHVLLQVFIPPNKMDISEDAPSCLTWRTCRQASTCQASPFTSAVPDQIQDSCRTLIFANKISIYLLPTHPLYYISRRQCNTMYWPTTSLPLVLERPTILLVLYTAMITFVELTFSFQHQFRSSHEATDSDSSLRVFCFLTDCRTWS